MSHVAALTEIVPHPTIPITYPPANLRYFCHHPWPTARPCEPGIVAPCAGCGLTFAPCTATRIDVAAVVERTWRCPSCAEGE